jgi:hypothetical protein
LKTGILGENSETDNGIHALAQGSSHVLVAFVACHTNPTHCKGRRSKIMIFIDYKLLLLSCVMIIEDLGDFYMQGEAEL